MTDMERLKVVKEIVDRFLEEGVDTKQLKEIAQALEALIVVEDRALRRELANILDSAEKERESKKRAKKNKEKK